MRGMIGTVVISAILAGLVGYASPDHSVGIAITLFLLFVVVGYCNFYSLSARAYMAYRCIRSSRYSSEAYFIYEKNKVNLSSFTPEERRKLFETIIRDAEAIGVNSHDHDRSRIASL